MDVGDFNKSTVSELKQYLQKRGVTVSGYRRQLLVELASAVFKCKLPVDPDFQQIDSKTSTTCKLKKLGIHCDPWTLAGFSNDFANIPDLGLYDIFNYLLCSRADYDGR